MPEKPRPAKPARAPEPVVTKLRHETRRSCATEPANGAHCSGAPHRANSGIPGRRTGQLCTGSMSAIRPFVRALSAQRCSADLLTEAGSARGRLVGMGEVSDATVSLCALCSGAVAGAAVSLTAPDVRRRSALKPRPDHASSRPCLVQTMPRPDHASPGHGSPGLCATDSALALTCPNDQQTLEPSI
jgi:hypothetical protein